MLDNFKAIDIRWDKANQEFYQDIVTVSGDTNGRQINLSIIENGSPVDLTNSKVKLYWGYKLTNYNSVTEFIAKDIKKGEFYFKFPTEMSRAGEITGNITIENPKDESVVVSRNLSIRVEGSQFGTSVEETQNKSDAIVSMILDAVPKDITASLDSKLDKTAIVDVAHGGTGGTTGASKIYKAYANSADGTKDFSMKYPNLNLLTDTRDFINKNLTGNNLKTSIVAPDSNVVKDGDVSYLNYTSTANEQDWFRAYLVSNWSTTPPLGFINANILPNTKYTFSFWAKGTGTHKIYAWQSWTTPFNISTTFTLTNDWEYYSFTVTSSTTIPVKDVEFFLRSVSSGTEINIKWPKVEQGAEATYWLPSESEVVANDYPQYIGTLTTFSATQSTTPSDYIWEKYSLNPFNIVSPVPVEKGGTGNATGVSKIYKAYAYSADGKTDFMLDYPNLNMIADSKFSKRADISLTDYSLKVFSSGGVSNSPYLTAKNTLTSAGYYDIVVGNFPVGSFKPNTKYTFSFYLKGSTTYTFIFPSLISNSAGTGSVDGTPFTPTSDGNFKWDASSDWKYHTYTFTTRASITETQSIIIRVTAGTEVSLALPKLEEGAKATTWLPTESEIVSSDLPSYVGTLSSFSSIQSVTPSDYTWKRDLNNLSTIKTYTAYADSIDGTTNFQTGKLQYNLIDGTRDFTNGWANNVTGSETDKYLGLTVKKRTAQWNGIYKTYTISDASTDYTFSGYLKTSGTGGTITRYVKINGSTVTSFNKSYTDLPWTLDVVTIPKGTLKVGDTVSVQYDISTLGTDYASYIAGHKWEKGSTNSKWLPMESEVMASDLPKYCGTMTSPYPVQSKLPSDYIWTKSPNLIDALVSQKMPVVTSDSASTGLAYVVTNTNLPTLTDGYTFVFIPSITSTVQSATVTINGTSYTFAKRGSYTSTFSAVSTDNAPVDFLRASCAYIVTIRSKTLVLNTTPDIERSSLATRAEGLNTKSLTTATDLNTLTAYGQSIVYLLNGQTITNLPTGFNNYSPLTACNGTQMMIDQTTGKIATRANNNGTWTTWLIR